METDDGYDAADNSAKSYDLAVKAMRQEYLAAKKAGQIDLLTENAERKKQGAAE